MVSNDAETLESEITKSSHNDVGIKMMQQPSAIGTYQNAMTSDNGRNSIRDALRAGGGQPLDHSTRLFMESRFGHDFGNVRIHTGNIASNSAESLGALAYTTGRDIVFREGMYAPQTATGKRLIAHELVHVIQQEKISSDAASAATIQRQESPEKDADKEKKEDDAGEVIAEGLKTVAEQAKDNNPKVKKEIIEPLKKAVEDKVESLSTGEKAIGISFGAATLGLIAGALLSDPQGRKLLEGVNLAAPLNLIPYVPLTGFTYTPPSDEIGKKSLFRFETTFSGNDYLKLITEKKHLPDMSLEVKMQWEYDSDGERLSVRGAQAKVGLMPGLSLSAGTYSGILSMPKTFMTPEGGFVTEKKSIPEIGGGGPSIPDTRVMLTVDLLKLDKRVIGNKLYNIIHAF
jgi:hypothetical protein